MPKSLLILLLIVSLSVHAQKIDIIQNNGGGALYNRQKVAASPAPLKYDKVVSGSAYFGSGWMNGRVILGPGGTVHDSLRLRIDLLDNTLHYLMNGIDMTVTSPAIKVVLLDPVTGAEYTLENSAYLLFPESAAKGWYQVLASGKTSMYKHIGKKLTEDRGYGSASTEQTITTTSQYFILKKTELIRVKKIKDIPDMFPDKKKEIEIFIRNNRLGQSDGDMGKVIDYYNSLLSAGGNVQ